MRCAPHAAEALLPHHCCVKGMPWAAHVLRMNCGVDQLLPLDSVSVNWLSRSVVDLTHVSPLFKVYAPQSWISAAGGSITV